MKRSINNKKNSICKEIVENNDNYYILYNMINQLYLYKPEFVKTVFNKIKSKSDNDDFNKFLKYFEDTYLKLFDY